MEQKKNYQSPNIDVVKLNIHQPILTESAGEGARSFEFTEPEED